MTTVFIIGDRVCSGEECVSSVPGERRSHRTGNLCGGVVRLKARTDA